MDSFEINKILGAVLAVLVFVVGLGIIAEVVFDQEKPEKPGFAVEVAASSEAGAQQKAEEQDPPIETLLATADPAKGEIVFKQCAACHTIDKGGRNGTGPNLYGVVGGPKTHKDDFNYSKGMKDAAAKGPWDYVALYTYLKNPKAYVPGNNMAFAGLRKPAARADLIAFLRSKSDNPPPLPK